MRPLIDIHNAEDDYRGHGRGMGRGRGRGFARGGFSTAGAERDVQRPSGSNAEWTTPAADVKTTAADLMSADSEAASAAGWGAPAADWGTPTADWSGRSPRLPALSIFFV